MRAGVDAALMRARVLMVCLACTALLVSSAAASAAPGQPPQGKVLLGVAGSTPAAFSKLTGARHHLRHVFVGWEQGVSWGRRFDDYLGQAHDEGYRMMFHLSTERMGAQRITPLQIARGRGDASLIAMSAMLNASGANVWVRPMAEMNGHWNLYCAFNADGSRKSASHSTASFRNAFRRIAVILRGGSVAGMNVRLKAHGMPKLNTDELLLPRSGQVALVWNPQGQGAPNVAGNQPADYWPGPAFVDYVANDLYSIKYNAFWKGMDSLYNQFRKPYVIAEWAPWGIDDAAFTRRMFAWVATHTRTAALVYFNGETSTLFRLSTKPKTLAAYRVGVRQSRYRCASC